MKKSICICDICGKEIDTTEVRHYVTVATTNGTPESVLGSVISVAGTITGMTSQVSQYDICSKCLKKLTPKKEVESEAKESVKEDSTSEES